MIQAKDYLGLLNNLGNEYFVRRLELVPDVREWARERGRDLSEPAQPMKLILDGDDLAMGVQSEFKEESLNNVINAAGVRWALRDTVSNIFERLNTVKKKLGFYFLKEYAHTVKDVSGNEVLEDDWAMRELERFGCFRE